jgi:hypothetical protein
MQNRVFRSYWILTIFCLCSSAFSLCAQSDDEPSARDLRRQAAAQQIQDLKSGTLIIRLASNYRKIKAMEDLILSETVSASSKKRLEAQLADTKKETNDRNSAIISAFQEEFTFSKVLFMHDTAMVRLKAGAPDHLFLSAEMTPADHIQRPEGPFFLLRIGKTRLEEQSRLDALVFMDESGEDLKRPFPYYLKINTFTYLIDRIFYPSGAFQKNIESRVKKLERRLRSFYESALEDAKS